jgi:hypothetical protein
LDESEFSDLTKGIPIGMELLETNAASGIIFSSSEKIAKKF